MRPGRRRISTLVTALLVPTLSLLAVPLAGARATSLPLAVRIGAAPRVAPSLVQLGSAPTAEELHAEIELKPSDPTALSQFVSEVSTPSSPLYGHYLSKGQFAARFGASEETLSAVTAALSSLGFHLGAPDPDGLFLPVSGDVATFEQALGIGFEDYRGPGGRTLFANTVAPALPSTIASSVAGILGLDNLSVQVSSSTGSALRVADDQPATTGPQPCAGEVRAGAPYSADKLAEAYGLNSVYSTGDLGSGTTVALFELEPSPTSSSDTAAFESCYGIGTTVGYESVDGGPIADGNAQDGVETQLDIDNVIELAPSANVIVYQGPNDLSEATADGPFDTYKQIVDDDSAQVISTSWAECEYDLGYSGSIGAEAESTLFAQAASQGQSVVAAAGDEGSAGCDYSGTSDPHPTTDLQVSDPAAQPDVTGVGGTTLSNVATTPPTEQAWTDGGGGISTFWTMPAYQAGAPAGLHVVNPNSSASPCAAASGYCREVPDVSADADPNTGYLIYWKGAWYSVGGTSGAAPLWAAVFALSDADTSCAVLPIGFANPALYAIAGSSNYSAAFNDITTGNNDGKDGDLYPAGAGYDMATGLGTPDAANLVPLLGNPCIASVSPAAGNPGQTVTITGENLRGATTVHFGTSSATPSSVASNGTSLTVTLPTGPAGSSVVNVTVTTARATSPTSSGGRFTFPASITSVSPSAGAAGATVTISGSGFSTVAPTGDVSFGGTPASYTVNSDSVITAVVPSAGTGTVPVTVTDAVGSSSSSNLDQFTYGVPVITALSARSGPSGTSVTIGGSGLANATSVSFGSTSVAPGSFAVISDGQIDVNAPTGPAGAVDVTVDNAAGISALSNADQFVYPPQVLALSLTAGSTAGGLQVVISGAGFSTVAPTGGVSFGGTTANYSVISDSTIDAVVPSEGPGTVDVTVIGSGGTSSLSGADLFSFEAPPTTEEPTATTSPTPTSTTIAAPPRLGPVSRARSQLSASPHAVTAGGGASATVTVTLEDAARQHVAGQKVTLQALQGSSQIRVLSSVSNAIGVARFAVSDRKLEFVTYRATDASSHLALSGRVTVSFGSPPSPSASTLRAASPPRTSCPGGDARVSITVTVRAKSGTALGGRLVSLAAAKGYRGTLASSSALTAANGVASFLATDPARQSVTFRASDNPDGVTLSQPLKINFPTPRRC